MIYISYELVTPTNLGKQLWHFVPLVKEAQSCIQTLSIKHLTSDSNFVYPKRQVLI